MGYRTYLGFISKDEHEKIKGFSLDELKEYFSEDHVGPYKIVVELYEFGKYTEFDDEKYYSPFFTNEETDKYYNSDYEFHVIGKEYIEHVIKYYNEKIKTYYKKMLDPFFPKDDIWGDNNEFLKSVKREYKDGEWSYSFDFSKIKPEEADALYKMIDHIRDMSSEWNLLTPYNLEKGDEVTKSWKYEYVIFELVRLYKSFDFENNILVYYGY
jgi:hypothetical protein